MVAVIGMCGALRKSEIHSMKFSDVEITPEAAVIKIPASKTNTRGSFAIAAGNDNGIDYLSYFITYYEHRAKITDAESFLLQFRNGKCTHQVVGKRTIELVPRMIARALNLPEPIYGTFSTAIIG